ncbi:hypothetical protein Ab1vBOLIVR4_gp123 [Agrobacterium phage OLIVR4]|nr:hypothetical protein Ab1vBOLIVR4_gp123 [Agrobacterium phage OLIVR4]
MKKVVQQSKTARPGDMVRAVVKLKGGAKSARVFVFSRYNGIGDFSPHVDDGALGVLNNGKPVMVRPFSVRLDRELKTKADFSFHASESLEFQIIEEVDFGEDINIKARIIIHGKASQTFRRIFGNIRRFFRRRPAA